MSIWVVMGQPERHKSRRRSKTLTAMKISLIQMDNGKVERAAQRCWQIPIAHGREIEWKANFKMVQKVGLARMNKLMFKIFILEPLMVPKMQIRVASAKSLEVEAVLNSKSTTASAPLVLQLEEAST